MNATSLYRTQQLAIAAAIDSGDYEKASDLLRRDLRTFAEPERAAPERSSTTGHNQTLTAPRKCGIIKAIRRHLRRVKRNQEGKKMKKYYVVLYSDSTQFEPFFSGSRNSVKHLTDHGAKECRVYDSDGYLISWAMADGDYSRNVRRCAVPKIYEPQAQELRIEL